MQGGNTKVYKKGYQVETLDNLIVGHSSHNGFPMDVSSLGVGSHYKSLCNHQSFQPSFALSQTQIHYIHMTKSSNLL
jgi:hypothetical protein